MRRISYRISMLKRMIVAGAALAVFLLPVFTPDARASDPRWYVGMSVPVMFLDDSESVTSGVNLGAPYSASASNEYKAGFKVSGMLGREFGNGFRLQVEGFFARADLSKLIYTGVTTQTAQGPLSLQGTDIPVSGPADQLGAMVNVWYDFNAGSRWRPFIGGGLGIVQIDWGGVDYEQGALEQSVANQLALLGARQQAGLPAGGSHDPPGFREGVLARAQLPPGAVPDLSDTDTVFAFKVGGGLGYELTNHITLQVSYRFFKTNQLEFNGRSSIGNTVNTVKATSDLQGHLFEVGARYRF